MDKIYDALNIVLGVLVIIGVLLIIVMLLLFIVELIMNFHQVIGV